MASTTPVDTPPTYAIATYHTIEQSGRTTVIRYKISARGLKLRQELAFAYNIITGEFVIHAFDPSAGGKRRLGPQLNWAELEMPIVFNPPPKRKKPFVTVRMLDAFDEWLGANSDIQLVPVAH